MRASFQNYEIIRIPASASHEGMDKRDNILYQELGQMNITDNAKSLTEDVLSTISLCGNNFVAATFLSLGAFFFVLLVSVQCLVFLLQFLGVR